jgi:hypothetical protein
MRVLLTLTVLAVLTGPAVANTDVVLGPVAAGGVKPADVAAVKAALGKANAGKLSATPIDVTCAGDPGCIAGKGAALNARRVLAVTVAPGGGADVRVSLVLVDVIGRLLLGTRDLTIPRKKLTSDVARAVAKFASEVPVDKAKAVFAEGNQAYNLGEFAQALERYKLAYRIMPLPAFQFNIAQCHRKLGQYKDAIAMYQAYLVGVPDAPDHDTVAQLIEESRTALEADTKEAARRESERLATERVRAEEARKAKEAEAAAEAERARVEQARIAAETERDKQYNQHPYRKWTILTGGVGLATIGAGAYFGVQTRELQRAYDQAGCGDLAQQQLTAPEIARCRADRDKGERNALISNVLIGSGAAIVVASLLVFVIDPGNLERPSEPRAAVRVSPSSVEVVLRW